MSTHSLSCAHLQPQFSLLFLEKNMSGREKCGAEAAAVPHGPIKIESAVPKIRSVRNIVGVFRRRDRNRRARSSDGGALHIYVCAYSCIGVHAYTRKSSPAQNAPKMQLVFASSDLTHALIPRVRLISTDHASTRVCLYSYAHDSPTVCRRCRESHVSCTRRYLIYDKYRSIKSV